MAKTLETARGKRHTDSSDPARAAHQALPSQEPDRAARLAKARSLLEQATTHPAPHPATKSDAPPKTPEAGFPDERADPFSNPFEDADPFEPFEQCAPAAAPEPQGHSAYSRSTERPRKAPDANNPRRPQRSLKGRALAYLSRREYSRAELSRKLRPYVQEADSLESTLDSLERDGWLSNERFVESVVHRRAARMGGSRIINELKRHAVGEALIGETADKLAQTETARAQAVWEKKYGVVPETPAERAKQARFLAARGFSASTIGKILKGGEEDWTDEPIDD
ncbi:Regulatory protein RecX [Burkholderia sp. 8Y]|uniref:recombination regulator RecX n=1 Tax=Burkholderia sp. 8Y TaxID=2653133 RepID=UPI0012F42AE6|nr:recombination regulator RecX [Burkholderia sp. 8Y]VXB57400.1 Regulatory protein RecX [Burkholderia sp. 8Y]